MFQTALQGAVEAGLPGAVMAVRDADGFWQGAAGYADLEREIPMEACHRTRIGSVSKTLFAATLMSLMERHGIHPDTTLGVLLPEERDRLPNIDDITVRQVLSHTSGIANFLEVSLVLALFNRPERTWTNRECYEHALGLQPAFDPGEGWSYSNTNYVLAGWIIEAITGRPHEDALHETLVAPLGMSSTSYTPDAFDFDGVVPGYFDLYGNQELINAFGTYADVSAGPDGAIVSSAHDILHFLDRLLSKKDLLSHEALVAMMPYVATGEPESSSYGLGLEAWREGDRLGIGHGGHEFGYRTFAYYFPAKDVTAVVWFNASSLIPTDENIAITINTQRDRLFDLALGLDP